MGDLGLQPLQRLKAGALLATGWGDDQHPVHAGDLIIQRPALGEDLHAVPQIAQEQVV